MKRMGNLCNLRRVEQCRIFTLIALIVSAILLPLTAGYDDLRVLADKQQQRDSYSTASIPIILPSPTATVSDSPTPSSPSSNEEFTAQAALSSPAARQTNNIVNTKAYYDIVFTTPTGGPIKRIDMVFPAGTDLSAVRLLEAEGIGPGGPGVTGNTLTYFVSSPVANVPAGAQIRLEFANIGNPAVPNAGYKVTVTTRDAAGTIIDGPTDTFTYVMKQIGNSDIADDAITGPKIAANTVMVGAQGFQNVSNLVNVPPLSDRFASVQCPPNHVITGGGFGAQSNGNLVYDGAFIDFSTNPIRWVVHAWNHDPSQVLQMQAIVQCLGATFNQ